MVSYYQHDIASWMDGTENLSDGAYRLYHVICQLIYLHEGPIVYNARGLAGRCSMRHELVTRYYIPQLLKAGKITIENGKISNVRCRSELSKIEDRRVARRSAPPTPRSPSAIGPPLVRSPPASPPLPSKPLKNNGPEPPTILDSLDLIDSREETRARRAWPFDEFWKVFPNKVGKQAAEKSFRRVERSRAVSFEELMAALRRYAGKTDDRPWCNPTTWLNQGRWEDRPASGPQPPPHPPAPVDPAKEAARAERRAREQAEYDEWKRQNGGQDARLSL